MEGARVAVSFRFRFRIPLLLLHLIRSNGAVVGYDDVAEFGVQVLSLGLILDGRIILAPEIVLVGARFGGLSFGELLLALLWV